MVIGALRLIHLLVFQYNFQELWNAGLARPSPSSDMLPFPGSSTKKALDLEASKGLVCKFKAQDVFRSKCYP